MRKFDEKIGSLTLLSRSSRDLQQQMFRDLNIIRDASSLDSAESSRSLASIASSLSKLEALIPPAQSTRPLEVTENDLRNPDDSEYSSSSPASFIQSGPELPPIHKVCKSVLTESKPGVEDGILGSLCCSRKSGSLQIEEHPRSDSPEHVEYRRNTDKGFLFKLS